MGRCGRLSRVRNAGSFLFSCELEARRLSLRNRAGARRVHLRNVPKHYLAENRLNTGSAEALPCEHSHLPGIGIRWWCGGDVQGNLLCREDVQGKCRS